MKIIDRNFRKPFGEIDIVAKNSNGLIVFIEVKTLVGGGVLRPEENLTAGKLKRFLKIVSYYIGANIQVINNKIGYRIDLIALTLPERISKELPELSKKMMTTEYLTNLLKDCVVNYYENIP